MTPWRPHVAQTRLRARNWGEREALALVMIAAVISMIIRLPMAMEAPLGDMRRETQLGTFVAANLLFAPLFMYLLAVLVRMALMALKRALGWLDARLLFFWTLLAFQPFIAIATFIDGKTDNATLSNLLSIALFAAFLAALWRGSAVYGNSGQEQRT